MGFSWAVVTNRALKGTESIDLIYWPQSSFNHHGTADERGIISPSTPTLRRTYRCFEVAVHICVYECECLCMPSGTVLLTRSSLSAAASNAANDEVRPSVFCVSYVCDVGLLLRIKGFASGLHTVW